MTQSIRLTPPQAQFLQSKMRAYQQARDDAARWLAFACAGHAPDGSAFVSVNPETGELLVEPPHPANIAASAPVRDIGEGPE